jgi:hypothetical protein
VRSVSITTWSEGWKLIDPAAELRVLGDGFIVFDPGGVPLGFVGVDETVANLPFGGGDWRTRFITSALVRAI